MSLQFPSSRRQRLQRQSCYGEAIYGEDSRKDSYQVTNPEIKKQMHSVAVIAPDTALRQTYDTRRYQIQQPRSYWQRFHADCPLADDNPFYNQRRFGRGTGFLVHPRFALTADHMVNKPEFPVARSKYVFSFHLDQRNQVVTEFPTTDVFAGERVVARSGDDGQDWALVKLRKGVHGDRVPFILSQTDTVRRNLYMLGHPCGLPTKYANGERLEDLGNSFRSSLDSFKGNSGSPILNLHSRVEGIQVAGTRPHFIQRDGHTYPAQYRVDQGEQYAQKITPPIRQALRDNVFGLYRDKALTYNQRGRTDKVVKNCRKALDQIPNNRQMRELLRRAQIQMQPASDEPAERPPLYADALPPSRQRPQTSYLVGNSVPTVPTVPPPPQQTPQRRRRPVTAPQPSAPLMSPRPYQSRRRLGLMTLSVSRQEKRRQKERRRRRRRRRSSSRSRSRQDQVPVQLVQNARLKFVSRGSNRHIPTECYLIIGNKGCYYGYIDSTGTSVYNDNYNKHQLLIEELVRRRQKKRLAKKLARKKRRYGFGFL